MAKNPDNLSINIHKMGTILLAFQLLAPAWHRKKGIVCMDITTAASNIENSTLRNSANALLCQILLLATRWNM